MNYNIQYSNSTSTEHNTNNTTWTQSVSSADYQIKFIRYFVDNDTPDTIYICGHHNGDGDGGDASSHISRKFLSNKILTSSNQTGTMANVLYAIQFGDLSNTFEMGTVTYNNTSEGSVSSTSQTTFSQNNLQDDGVKLQLYNLGNSISNRYIYSEHSYMFIIGHHNDSEEVIIGNTPFLSGEIKMIE